VRAMRNAVDTRRRAARRSPARRGAVVVEFAFLAPVLLVILFGLVEASRLVNVNNLLANAAREGARMAALDRNDLLGEGQTTNDKITNDVKNFMEAAGLPGDEINVEILDADNPDLPFDLDDPDNDLELFVLRVELPYAAVNPAAPPGMSDLVLSSEVVFRNARAPNLVE